MFEKLAKFIRKFMNSDKKDGKSKDAAKERLQLVLMQDRANVSADFLELMKQEIIDVIKKYIDVDESAIDVRLTNRTNEDGTNGAPALYADIPIINIKHDMQIKKEDKNGKQEENKQEVKKEENKKEKEEENKKEDDLNKEENTSKKQENEKENKKQDTSKNLENKQEDKEKTEQENKKQEKEEIQAEKKEQQESKTDNEAKNEEKQVQQSQ